MAKAPLNLYELVPTQRRESRERADGNVEVLIPRYGDNPVGRLLKYVFSNKPVKVELDDVGTRVWRLCDGHRNVREIGQSLQGEFGERLEPLYDRLGEFLKQMKRAGLIDFKN